jgi:hypothetical protein
VVYFEVKSGIDVVYSLNTFFLLKIYLEDFLSIENIEYLFLPVQLVKESNSSQG